LKTDRKSNISNLIKNAKKKQHLYERLQILAENIKKDKILQAKEKIY
jgi:hypothetical protein